MKHILLKTKQTGFTLVEVVAGVVVLTILISILLVVVVRYSEDDSNAQIVIQVNDYIAALEQSFQPTYGRYPTVFNLEGQAATNLDQFGCMAQTTDEGCIFNGEEEPLYPSASGLSRLSEFAIVVPLATPVTDFEGDLFDSILYSSNGSKFRIRYPLAGDDTDCGVQYAYEVSAGSAGYQGVTICVYESR